MGENTELKEHVPPGQGHVGQQPANVSPASADPNPAPMAPLKAEGNTEGGHKTAKSDGSTEHPKQESISDNTENSQNPENTENGPQTVDGFIDYNQIYEQLLDRYNRAYSISQKLFVTEKTQRRTLYHYKRRVNALLDVLADMEETDNADEPLHIDHARISSLLQWQPDLEKCLEPALKIAAGNAPSEIPLKRSYAVNLAVEEQVPEIANDELDSIELNPQDTDMWIRRNFLHLVVSKFRPAEIRAKGVREYVDPLAFGSKRKRRS